MRRPYVPAFAANGCLIFSTHIYLFSLLFFHNAHSSVLLMMFFVVFFFFFNARPEIFMSLLFLTNYLHLHLVPLGLPHIDCRHITLIHWFCES